MESIPSQRSSNGSNTNSDAAGAKRFKLHTNTSPAEGRSGSGNNESPITSPSSITSPPYWVQSHQRSFSNISVESIPNGAITLQDNEEDGEDAKNKACWARNVHIDGYVIVNGTMTSLGAFVVWNITVDTLHVGHRLLCHAGPASLNRS